MTAQATPAATAPEDIIYDLSDYALIAASGDDTVTFLQGQLSNDVRNVNNGSSQLSSYNTPKGRALACFRLFRHGEKTYLQLPKEILEPTLKRLRMYVLRSKVVLEDASSSLLGIGLCGPHAAEHIMALVGSAPAAVDAATQGNGLTAVRIAGDTPRFEIYGDGPSRTQAWDYLAARAKIVDWSAWRLLNIRAGIPTIFKGTSEEFVPQMINLELLHGISFTKGCYTGQEIVARMHYLGTLKKRMYRLRGDCAQVPQPNDRVYEHGTGNDQAIGQMVDAQPTAEGGFEALAVMQKVSVENNALRLGSVDGEKLEVLPLPYAFE